MLKLISPGDEAYLGAIENYFKRRMANARRLLALSKESEDLTFEVLLLCCCALDALGGLFLEDDRGKKEKNEEQFRELLWRYGETRQFKFDRVNVVVLCRKINEYKAKWKHEKEENIDFPNVQRYLEGEISKHDYGTGEALDLDLPYEEVESACRELLRQDGDLGRWGWLSNLIRESTHAGVLYEQYRCPAVHQGQVSGHWGSDGRNCQPFYMPVIGEGVDFTFPEPFLIDVVEQVLRCILYSHLAPESVEQK